MEESAPQEGEMSAMFAFIPNLCSVMKQVTVIAYNFLHFCLIQLNPYSF